MQIEIREGKKSRRFHLPFIDFITRYDRSKISITGRERFDGRLDRLVENRENYRIFDAVNFGKLTRQSILTEYNVF